MVDRPALPAQREVHAGEDVLGQVERLGRLGDAALLHHEDLVHDVRVAVVHPRPQGRVGSLQDGAEGDLRGRGEVADRADVACDVLREPNDALRLRIAAVTRAEFAEGAGQEQHLLEVSTLVGIDALRKMAAHEGNGVVLVVAFAVAKDGIPWQLDAQLGYPGPVWQRVASLVDQTTEVSAALARVHVICVGGSPFALAINEGHLQAIWELLEHLVRVVDLRLVKELVHLHRD
mmetsp:Transcript_109177/g.282166  ORF Transcript_109177/g.282166 Transcript_109177/m.282166 type:complete len:233 (+) Transcript_109177:831-1529(+)